MNADSKLALLSEELLSQAHIKLLIQQLRDLVCLPTPHFELFYQTPIVRFLTLTQHCSEEHLVIHLSAVIKALKLRRTLILPLDSDAESINKKKDLWTYAIFVGSLMFNSVELIGQQVVITESNGSRKWTPFDPRLPAKQKRQVVGKLPLNDITVIMFFPMVLCTQCLAWLYRDIEVFNTALILAYSPHHITRIGLLVTQAHDVEIDTTHTNVQSLNKAGSAISDLHPSQSKISSSEVTAPRNSDVPSFGMWLKTSIENNRYPQFVCETLDGHAICDHLIFEQYCKDTGKAIHDIEQKRKVFMSQGIHKRCSNMKFSGGGFRKAFIIRKLADLT